MKPLSVPSFSAILLLATVSLMSCSGRNGRSLYDEARAAQDSGNFVLAAEAYDRVAREYPAEAIAETALYRVVEIRSNTSGDRRPAVEAQRRFLELFPRSGWAPKITFMLAFNYNNELAEYDSARKYYELFLERYPDDELAASARFELGSIGKGPEELLMEAPAAGTKAGGENAPGATPAGTARPE